MSTSPEVHDVVTTPAPPTTITTTIPTSFIQPVIIGPTAVKKQQDHHVVRNSILAGSLAGIASTLACHPFDVLRTKMQAATIELALSSASSTTTTTTTVTKLSQAAAAAATSSTSSSSWAASARGATLKQLAGGPLQVLSHTVQHGGMAALYTGLALPLAAQAVYKSTLFTINNLSQKCLLDWHTTSTPAKRRKLAGNNVPYRLSLIDRFWCGFVAGGVNAALFVTPVEFVRNKLIEQHTRRSATIQQPQQLQSRFMGSLDVIRQTISQSPRGVLGLWRGIGMTVARDSIGCGFFFLAMASTQQYCKATTTTRHWSALQINLVAGAMAGLSFWAVALPLDTLKTWVQTGATPSAIDTVRQSYAAQGMWNTARQLTRGWQVAFGRGAPSAAITIVTYEYCYNYLQ